MSLIAKLSDWADDRTGYRGLVTEALYENIPSGSRWRYVFGSMLVFAFVTQAITGIFLWMSYSAGSQNAWASVYYIQNEMQGGWLLRGVHHYMAQFMVVLLPLHLFQVVWDKAYKAPREFNYWLGLVLMLIVLGLGLTGYLLPWDQKGFWATKVATEIMGLPPGGAQTQLLVVGGSQYGHFTLTRFFALHAGVLPGLLMFFLALHLALFRKHGITAHRSPRRSDQYFWPQQVFKDGIACLLMLIAVIVIVCFKEAELGPPAVPTETYKAARPEWYFLFLFQLLKKFESEFVGAILVPGGIMAFLFAVPLIARIKMGHFVNVVVIVSLIVGAGYLTVEAIQEDNYAQWSGDKTPPTDPKQLAAHNEKIKASREFHEAKARTHRDYVRMKALIEHYGIPLEGPRALRRTDPEIMGPRLFARSCASCHSYYDPHAGDGENHEQEHAAESQFPLASDPEEESGAPNLYRFGSRQWLKDFLSVKGIDSNQFFGLTAHKEGEMSAYVTGNLDGLDADQQKLLDQTIAALSAEAKLVYQADMDAEDASMIAAGRKVLSGELIINEEAGESCTDCHSYRDTEGAAPDLTGYGSLKWLVDLISDPAEARFYGENNDRMPSFHTEAAKLLTAEEVELLARWIRRDDADLALKLKLDTAAANAAETTAAAKKPDEEKPDEEKPDEKKSDEKKPDEKKPDEKKSDEKKPDEKKPDEKKPDEKKPDEKKSDEKKPDEKKPDEKKSDEKKSDEKKPDEKKPDEKKSDEKKPDEKKPDEKKPDEKKSDEKK